MQVSRYGDLANYMIPVSGFKPIVNFLNIRTPKKIVVITLKVEQDGVSLE